MSHTISKCKKCRREGKKLFLKGDRCLSAKCAMVKRNYVPGQHGVKGKPRLTPYGIQLREKQKAKRLYGMSERQFRNYYDRAIKKEGDTGEILLNLLEHRFDNIIYRSGFAKSRSQARQLVNHGHFLVNNKKVNIPSYQFRVGDTIHLVKKSKESKIFTEMFKAIDESKIPSWLYVDKENFTIKIVGKPTLAEMSQEFDTKSIVEFYSR